MRGRWAPVVLGSLLLGSCSDSGASEEAGPAVTEPTTSIADSTTSTTTTVTTVPPDPYAVPPDPADIDEAYVERVANELYRVLSEANALQLEGATSDRLIPIYNSVLTPAAADSLLADALARTSADLDRLKRPPGPHEINVTRVLEAHRNCVVAEAFRDSSAVLTGDSTPLKGVLVLRGGPTSVLNPTPWLIEGFSPSALQNGYTCSD